MRLDLRLVAGRLHYLLGAHTPRIMLTTLARAMLAAYELLCVSSLIERRVAERYHPQADLLKVAHNGSLTSTAPELLASLRPRWAVISVGARNTFGHPRVETLKRLQEAGTATCRTDLNGAVTFYLDGSSVTPQLACLR